MIFMQDNAPVHTTRVIRDWLKEHGIEIINWPLYSLDLNLIEHLWFHLKKLMYNIAPDIEQVGGSDDMIQEALFQALKEAWPRIRQKLLNVLIESMKSRINAVIEAKGWYTKY